MTNFLPQISINTDVTGLAFLDRVEDFARKQGGFSVQKRDPRSISAPCYSLRLSPHTMTKQKNLSALLIAHSDGRPRVRVQMVARKWSSDPPSYEEYADSAKDICSQLLRLYNRKHRARVRLSIQRKQAAYKRLPPLALRYFDSFVNLANKEILHPLDWERFYSFIRFCHKRSMKLAGYELQQLLKREGFEPEEAENLGTIYDHGRGILRAPASDSWWMHEARRV